MRLKKVLEYSEVPLKASSRHRMHDVLLRRKNCVGIIIWYDFQRQNGSNIHCARISRIEKKRTLHHVKSTSPLLSPSKPPRINIIVNSIINLYSPCRVYHFQISLVSTKILLMSLRFRHKACLTNNGFSSVDYHEKFILRKWKFH